MDFASPGRVLAEKTEQAKKAKAADDIAGHSQKTG